MTEQFRQQPENPKQHTPEAGAGQIGKPPQGPEYDLRGQGQEAPPAQRGNESTRVQPTGEEIRKANEEFFEKLRRINPEGRKRAQKRLMDYLFRRLPQDPKQEK